MKNFLIFLSLFTVVLLASWDAKERLQELDVIAGKTPAQVEMKDDIIKPLKQETTMQHGSKVQVPPKMDNIFNEKVKEQQSNNLPQQKQPNPLKIQN